MKNKSFFLTAVFLFLTIFACTPKDPSIRIDYIVPDASDVFKGKTVSIRVVDEREYKNILDPAAFTKFDNFNGKFSFAHKNKDELLGIHNAPSLFETALKTRLRKQGVKFTTPADGIPEIVVILKKFILKYDGGWKVNITFEAQLNKDGKYLSKESISNNSEDPMGFKSHGVSLLENSFSEVINKLNIERLFEKSNL